jgi:sulfur relay (sulfurtransferase) DsrC/TusE family protein
LIKQRDVTIKLAKKENLELNDEYWLVLNLMHDVYIFK